MSRLLAAALVLVALAATYQVGSIRTRSVEADANTCAIARHTQLLAWTTGLLYDAVRAEHRDVANAITALSQEQGRIREDAFGPSLAAASASTIRIYGSSVTSGDLWALNEVSRTNSDLLVLAHCGS